MILGAKQISPNAFFLNSQQSLALFAAPSPIPSNLLAEVVFETDDLRELLKYLSSLKIQFTPKLVSGIQHWDLILPGYSALSLIDPEGRRISFVQAPKPPLSPNRKSATNPTSGLRLIHAGFIVRDRAATEHFYKDILGFHVYWHGGMKDGTDDWVDMQVPDGTDWIEYMLNVSPSADKKELGVMNHIALGVPDIKAAREQLLRNGMKLTEEPQIGRDGKWQLNLYDPDDTRVELMEFTPVQKPCCSEYTGPHPKP
jgi:catechol 2,3-dioxygenase-like lactoylglutathione lyase family enzyme